MPIRNERTEKWVTFTEEEVREILAREAGVVVEDIKRVTYPEFSIYYQTKTITVYLK